MGLFDKFKSIFTGNKVEQKEVEIYDKGLEKTRKEFVSKISLLNLKYTKISPEYFEELEEILIMVKHENIEDSEDLKEIIVDEMFIIYVDNSIMVNKIQFAESGPTVILFVGVNGVGKTTTIGKIAHKLKKEGKKVLLVAGDTFRAGAIEQIKEWGERTDAPVIYKEEADPASVIFDGVTKAVEENYDVVLIDTAGRLQNKSNLMNELEKINKVIGKVLPDAPHETLLVVDATTGQNGISQAKEFKKITYLRICDSMNNVKVIEIKTFDSKKLCLYLQMILIILLAVFGVITLFFNKDMLKVFYFILAATLAVMTWNNHKIYKRKYLTIVYGAFALFSLVSGILELL